VELGSSQLISEISAAFLLAQLESAADVNANRRKTWDLYLDGLASLSQSGAIELPTLPDECQHNGHCFYVKTADLGERKAVMKALEERSVRSVFHYIPLHSAPAGLRLGRFHGEDRFTTRESERLLRLPLYYDMDESDVRWVIDSLYAAYGRRPGS
jgi:dTDP-4-amino-4,6-dideoxygalactose transaminase